MALLAAWRRGVASCSGKNLPFQARFQNPAAAFDQFLGEELNYVDPSDEADATPGTQALRTDTFVREVEPHQIICANYTIGAHVRASFRIKTFVVASLQILKSLFSCTCRPSRC